MPTLDEIRHILEAGDFNTLIGLKEDLFLEVKGRPYDFTSPSGRYELAKDVSAFANSEGGYLLIGLMTVPLDVERTEEISALSLISAANFPIPRYEGIINEYIHPRIEGLQVTWSESVQTAGMGLGCIYVPSQHEERKYFLIAKVVDEGEQIRQIAFGIARRRESSNDPLPVSDLYRMTQNGRNTTAQRLLEINEKLDLVLEAQRKPSQKSPIETLDARIRRILKS